MSSNSLKEKTKQRKPIYFSGDICVCKTGFFSKKEKCNYKPSYRCIVYTNTLRTDANFELVYYKSYDYDCDDEKVKTYLVNSASWTSKEDNRYKRTFGRSSCNIYTWVFKKIVVDYTDNSISFINKFNNRRMVFRVHRKLLKSTVERLQENGYPIEYI